MNFDRTTAVKEAKLKSARADMKQHADKLIQGFEKLNESHAKRAIWELVQNACDLSDHCEIVIDFQNNGISFSHNGRPFSSETLISLIKQVSSKDPDKTDDVGQFGTGFIATHSFGKIINLSSILKEDEFHIVINDFKIDRYAKSSDELVEKLVIQELNVYQLINEGTIIDSPDIVTTFSYLSDYPQDKDNIKQAEGNLHHYIPIVLALNDSFKSAKVIASDGKVTVYKKDVEEFDGEVIKIPVLKNDVNINVFCIRSEDKNIQIVLPLTDKLETKQLDGHIAKLFLFFPLIGTEEWGCNFIIHSKQFAPTEQRDGVHLKSKNEQTQKKEEDNRCVLEKATEMIFAYSDRNAGSLSAPINIAHINFDTKTNTEITNSYYKELKQKWCKKFKTLKIVETEESRETPTNLLFISPSLLLDELYFDSVYSLIAMFWKNKVPKKDIAQKWTKIVIEWEDDSIHFLSIEMLVEKISDQGNLLIFDESVLQSFYKYLIKYYDIKVFENHKLLPNIKNELVRKGDLRRPINIDSRYIVVSDTLIPDIPKKYVKGNFELGLEFSNYNRKNLSDDFNTKINTVTKELTGDKFSTVDVIFRDGLICLCSIFSSETAQSTRRQIMPIICNFYTLDYTEQIIPNIEDEKFDYDYTPFRGLVRIFLLDIVKKSNEEIDWVEKEISFLQDCLGVLAPHKELKDIIESLPVFPNQNFKLCKQVDLRIEKNFPSHPPDADFLKEKYREIVHDIRNELVLNDFESFLFHTNVQTGLELSGELENVFKSNGSYEEIILHPNKVVIFQIVQKITNNNEWSTFFPTLEDKKAIIMMAKISDPAVKDHLFSIIGLDDKNRIALLGKLAKNPDLERIIKLGTQALEDEKIRNADFEFLNKIGVHIEDLIRGKIKKDVEGLSIKVNNEQGGQDIVVRLYDKPIFFIEVKSRWDNNNSIKMSYNQSKRAAKNKECYSLCCVEMCDYIPSDGGNRFDVQDIMLIVDRIKFVNDIGSRIEPLISNAISAELNENEVRLTEEYRVIVPQTVVKTGKTLDIFINFLIDFINLKININA